MNFQTFSSFPKQIASKLSSSPQLSKAMSSTGWLLSEQLFSMILGFTINIYLIRYLGPERLGIYSYGLSLVSIIGILAKLGIDGLIVRDLVQSKDLAPKILGTAFVLKLVGGLISVGIIATILVVLNNEIETQAITNILAISIIFYAFDVINFWNQSQVQARAMASIRFTTNLISFASKCILIYISAPLIFFAWLFALEAAFRSAGMVASYQIAKQSVFYWRIDWTYAAQLLKESWPLLISSAMAIIYMKIDQLMLAWISGPKSVGVYSAAAKFSEIWYFIPMALTASLFPALVKLKQEDPSIFKQRMQQLFDLLSWCAYGLAIPITIFGPIIIPKILGADFTDSSIILTIHIWAGIFVFLETGRIRWLLVEKQNLFQLLSMAIGATSNILLNLALIPRLQGFGAAIATLISYWVAIIGTCFMIRKHREMGKMLLLASIIPARWQQNSEYIKILLGSKNTYNTSKNQ